MNLEPYKQRMNLEPYKQRLSDRLASPYRFGRSVTDDLDDLIREVERLRAEVAALRNEAPAGGIVAGN